MRVALDTTFAERGHSGTGVIIRQLTQALRDEGVDVIELANTARRAPAGGGLGSLRNAAADAHWTQVELPRRAARANADVLHHPLPALARRAPCPQVVNVNDLAYLRLPECFDPKFRIYAARAHRAAVLQADAVVCISETTRRDVLARWGADPARLIVAPLGPGQPLHVRHEEPTHFLYIGDDEPRKNLPVLLQAFSRYRTAGGTLDLVLAGRATNDGPGIRNEPTPDLPDLLGTTAALVHPSLHEGFGLTPLEAMAAGVPVIAGRSPGLAETCGSAALLVDPRDPGALADAMTRVAGNDKLRTDLRAFGLARAADFSWRTCAQQVIKAYRLAT